MAIAKYTPTYEPSVKANMPKIEPSTYMGIVVDDKITPIKSLVAYVEGAPWSVVYYGQVVAEHNDLREIDTIEPNIYQQYTKTNNLEIRVTSALSDSYDTQTGISTVVGSGHMYGSILPNVNDYFSSDTGDNKTGLFRITNVERKSFNRDSVFYIDYSMVGYTDSNAVSAMLEALETKSTREYFFHKDRLMDGLQPLLRAEETQAIINIKEAYSTIVKDYFHQFFSIKHGTLVLPGQPISIYDTFIVSYLLQIVDSHDAVQIREIKQLANEREYYMSQNQFWKAMLERDYDMISYGNKKMGLIRKGLFNRNSYLYGFAFTTINQLVYPVAPDTTSFGNYDTLPFTADPTLQITETKNIQGSIASLITDTYITQSGTIPIIHTVLTDDYYVLSNNFYNNTAQKSVLEILVKDYMQGKTINMSMLQACLNKYRSWSRLEQFYYGPILLTLFKTASNQTYS
jgi:hypothetical protein